MTGDMNDRAESSQNGSDNTTKTSDLNDHADRKPMPDDIAARLWSWSVHTGDSLFADAAAEIERLRPPDGCLAVMLTIDHVEREATQSPDHVEDDLHSVTEACYLAWKRYTEQENQ